MNDETTEETIENVEETPVVEEDDGPGYTEEEADEARAFGWKSPDEWTGDIPAGYIDDPKRYMERAENFTPFRKLKESQAEILRKLDAVSESNLKRQAEQLQAQHAAEIKRIKDAQREAVEVGDADEYDRLEGERENLEAPKDKKDELAPDVRSAMDNWSAKNTWFKTDTAMTAAATAYYSEAQSKGMEDVNACLTYVDNAMKEAFPSKFGAAPERKTARVDGDGLHLNGGKKEGFSTLPKEAKQAFKKNVAQGLFTDDAAGQEEYYNEYVNA